MKKNILTVFISVAALLSLLISGCAIRQATVKQNNALAAIAATIAEAEAMDAVDCAPRELARARAALDHARHEASAEHEEEAETYIKTAKKAADKLLATTRPCWEARQVKPAPEVNAFIEPASIAAGGCAVLTWNSLNAGQVRLDPGGDNLPLSGAREVCPTTSTLYQLTASGPGGSATVSANLEVIETLADVAAPQMVTERFTPVYFDFDRALIRDDAKPVLEELAAALKADSSFKLLLEGHCDERGTNEYNTALGERRAAAAKRYLKNLGVDVSRLNTLSYGEERPADPGHDEAAWALNRRVEFVVK